MAKKALLIGVAKYLNRRDEWVGPGLKFEARDKSRRSVLSDLAAFEALLRSQGFTDITRLDTPQATTRERLLEKLRWFFERHARRGDRLVLYYSGHAQRRPALLVHGRALLEEVICPSDTDWRDRVISDRTLGEIASAALRRNATLEVFLETCSAGGLIEDDDARGFFDRRMPGPLGSILEGVEIPVWHILPTGSVVVWGASTASTCSYAGPVPRVMRKGSRMILAPTTRGLFTHYLVEHYRRSVSRQDLLARITASIADYRARHVKNCGAQACAMEAYAQEPRLDVFGDESLAHLPVLQYVNPAKGIKLPVQPMRPPLSLPRPLLPQ